MELKKEYKQTEVGMIPEKWEVVGLGNVLNRIADVDHYMPKTEKYGVPYVMTGDLQELVENIDFDNCKKISLADYKKLSKKIKNTKGDIILARYATVGTVSFVNIDFDFVVSYSCVTIKPDTSKISNLFLYYYFKSSLFKIEVKNKVNANIQDNVGIRDLIEMQIPLPPIPEQTAIATVLSDMDNLLQALQKKIAKKRLIKQGAMQELLKPKEGWVEKTIESLCKTFTKQTGFDYSAHIKPTLFNSYEKGSIPFIQNKDFRAKNINYKTDYYIPEIVANNFPRILLDEKCMLISISGSIGNVGVFDNFQKAFIGGAVAVAKFKNKNEIDWVLYYLLSNEGQNKLFRDVKSGSHQNLTLEDIRKITVPFPIREEQIRIATILSDMDNEIENLEKQLEKYKEVKQGLMQDLLTGKVRLV